MYKANHEPPIIKSRTNIMFLSNNDYDVQTEFSCSEEIFIPAKYMIKLEADIIAEVMIQIARSRSLT